MTKGPNKEPGRPIRLTDDTYEKLDKLRHPNESWNECLHRLLNIPYNPVTQPRLYRKHNKEEKNG